MRSESQVELSHGRATPNQEQHLTAVPQGLALVFQEALRRRGTRLANEVETYITDSCKPGPSPGRLSFAPCLTALGYLQDQVVTSCASQTPCSRRARLPRILTIECLEQLTVIDATDVNETFLSQLAYAGCLERFQFMIVAPSFKEQRASLELDNTILKWPEASLGHSSLRG